MTLSQKKTIRIIKIFYYFLLSINLRLVNDYPTIVTTFWLLKFWCMVIAIYSRQNSSVLHPNIREAWRIVRNDDAQWIAYLSVVLFVLYYITCIPICWFRAVRRRRGRVLEKRIYDVFTHFLWQRIYPKTCIVRSVQAAY